MAVAESDDRADAARRAIERARAKAGDAIGRDPALARRVLEEHLPQDLAAVSVLVAAVRDCVPDRLAEDLPGHPADQVLARLADSLATRESLAPERARWAVAVWAVGLGLADTAAPKPGAAAAAQSPATTAAAPRDPAPTRPVFPPPPPPRNDAVPAKPGGRGRLALLIAAIAVVALIVVGGGFLLLRPTVDTTTVAKPAKTGASPTPTPTPTALPAILVAAHRGGNEIYPLETAQAMLDAAKRPGVAVETDMRFTADGVPVLVHDATVDAGMPCAGPTPRPKIADKTFAWLSTNCHTLASASPSGGRYTIPKVDDVARQLAATGRSQWLLEIKTPLTPSQETEVFDLLTRDKMIDRTVLTSFFPVELAKARTEAQRRGLKIRLLQFVPNTSMSAATAAENGLWAVAVQSPALSKAYVSALHVEGVKAVEWTPDTVDEWQRAETAGADFVITDKPVAWAAWKSTDQGPNAEAGASRAPLSRTIPSRAATTRPSTSTTPSPTLTPTPTPTVAVTPTSGTG